MFANRFDTLMNIARVSNSQMGQAVNMNGSYIGRLRSGARPLPRKHPYLSLMCRYLAEHMTQELQLETLFKLTGIPVDHQMSQDSLAAMLERWLLKTEEDSGAAAGRFISGFTRVSAAPLHIPAASNPEPQSIRYASYLFGNEGKRRAVEQFFRMLLMEKEPQTLLLFSEEHMAWMYEDPVFARRWAELFTQVLLRGNRVKIIHTVSRTMNEILEAVMKWVPIYMTGAIEPYYYPRLRDDLFQHTLFLAPRTAAVISTSVQQNTEGMLNEFITDREALAALVTEYERYFALCKPLVEIFTQRDLTGLEPVLQNLDAASGTAYIRTALPPIFCLPRHVVEELEVPALLDRWNSCRQAFLWGIRRNRLNLTLLDPEQALTSDRLLLTEAGLLGLPPVNLTREQYEAALRTLGELAAEYPDLQVRCQKDLVCNNFLYVKENGGVMMAKTDAPVAAFVLQEQNMLYAFQGYMRRDFENSDPLV